MLTFIEMEFLKLKRSNIFMLSLFGAILPPLLMFIAVFAFDEGHTFDLLFKNVNMYMSALFAVMLFAIMISYLFGREYNEHTLKTMLTIPVSRGKFLLSKYVMFRLHLLADTKYGSGDGRRSRLGIGEHADLRPDLGAVCSLGVPISDSLR